MPGKQRATEHAPVSASKKRTRVVFSEDDKKRAVAALLTIGKDHPFSADAMAAANAVLGVEMSSSVYGDWVRAYGEQVRALMPAPTDVEIVKQVQDSLISDLTDIQRLIIGHIKADTKVVGSASLRDSMVSLGIASDKIDQWLGVSAEMRSRCNRLVSLCQQAEIDPVLVFDDMLLSLNRYVQERLAARTITISATTPNDNDDNTTTIDKPA